MATQVHPEQYPVSQIPPEPPSSMYETPGASVPTAVPIAEAGLAPAAAPAAPIVANSMFAHDAISVQQTKRGCFQEMCGCEAKSEYRVYPGHVEEGQPRDEGIAQMGHLLEESSFFCRLCFASQRGFVMKLAAGSLPAETPGAGPTVMVYEKPFGLPVCWNCYIPTDGGVHKIPIPCCCYLPEIVTKTPEGRVLGSSQYECDSNLLVPKFKVKDANGNITYKIKPDTCCCGLCIKCRCGFGRQSKAIYVPFEIRDPVTMEPMTSVYEGQPAQVRKVWSGWKKECCTDADNFHVIFPAVSPQHQPRKPNPKNPHIVKSPPGTRWRGHRARTIYFQP